MTACAWRPGAAEVGLARSAGTVVLCDVRAPERAVGEWRVAVPAEACAWSGDGAVLVVGDAGGTVHELDVRSSVGVTAEVRHSDAVRAVGVVPGGRTVVSGSDDGMLRVGAAQRWRAAEYIRAAVPVDADRVLVAAWDRTVRLLAL